MSVVNLVLMPSSQNGAEPTQSRTEQAKASWTKPLAQSLLLNSITALVANIYTSFTLFNYVYTVGTTSVPIILCSPINKTQNPLLYKIQEKLHNLAALTFLLMHILENLTNPSLQGISKIILTSVYVLSILAQKLVLYSPKKPSTQDRLIHKKTLFHFFTFLCYSLTLILYMTTPVPLNGHHKAAHYNTVLRSTILLCRTTSKLYNSQKNHPGKYKKNTLLYHTCFLFFIRMCSRMLWQKLNYTSTFLTGKPWKSKLSKSQKPKAPLLPTPKRKKNIHRLFRSIIHKSLDALPF